MALVTVELRNLLKTDFELFDFDYRFDDENMKEEIEQAIIDYYYFEEIGQETPERFKLVFKRRFLSAIEYYNELHNTTLLQYDPLVNYRMTENLERLGNTKTQSTADTTSQSESLDNTTSENTTNATTTRNTNENESGSSGNIDYPQNNFPSDYRSEESNNTVDREQTQNTDSEQTTNTTGNTKINTDGKTLALQDSDTNTTENYVKTIEALTGRTYQELIRLERENILRIKQNIIQELKSCFILTYN